MDRLIRDLSDGYAERGVAVQDGYADLRLGDLAVEVPRHEPLPQQFHTVHLRLDANSAMVAAPVSPKCPVKVFRRPEGHCQFGCMDASRDDVLAYMDFPREHWAQIASTNPLERVNREIKRRSDVIGVRAFLQTSGSHALTPQR